MKKLIFVFVLFLISLSSIAQPAIDKGRYTLTWGPLVRYTGKMEKIVNIKEDRFSVIVNKNNLFSVLFPNRRKLIIKEMRSLIPISEQKIKLKGNGRRIAPKSVTDANADIYTLSTRTRMFGIRQELFYNKINYSNMDKISVGNEVMSYNKSFRATSKKKIGMVSSDDFSHAAGFYTIPVGRGEYPGFGYVFFNENGVYDKNVIQLPFMSFQFDIYDNFISNNGDFYLIGKEFYKTFPNQMWNPNNRIFGNTIIFKVVDGQFKNVDVFQPNYQIQEIKLAKEDENNLVCSGFYSDDSFSGVRGVFLLHMDQTTNEVINSVKIPFTMEFLNAGKAAWERTWRDRFISANSRNQGLHNFIMLDFRKTKDGGYIGIAEHQDMQVRVKRRTSTDSKGNKSTKETYERHFYFDDVIVYKLTESGQLEWVNRIPKTQQSKDDEGFFNSIAHGMSDKTIILTFNDNKRNYDDAGHFKNEGFAIRANYTRFWNVMAVVEIDISTGQLKRTMMPGRSELNTFLVPKLCRYNVETNDLILFGRRGFRKNRFGRIHIK